MSYGMTRDQAWELLTRHVQSPNMLKHCLASEAVLRSLAVRLGEDPEKWGLAGLLHDLDVEQTAEDMTRHTHQTAVILREAGVAEEIIDAIRLHNEMAHPEKRSTTFQHALAAGETITGLIIATALVYPDRKLASVKAKSVRKRMKEKAFAAGANREIILECEKTGIPIDEFCELCLQAMQGIAPDLEL
ncbi:phosphohydrolase [Desulfuromonas versatilis]|uniref:Phosphohydrolase n=1 Tax=Desulfuromonas versatilis TaxID=2802975 RepID=A0ABN6DSZ0_9BACT|nr:HDIG domain-containing metalloprotein [Desulfuromonas versatilis]BCR03290.1 phosphohydrolase [Desulfuromonas versatilis]